MKRTLLLSCIALYGTFTLAGEVKTIESATYVTAEQELAHFRTMYPSEDVWFVSDIDNTLLAQNQDLGSDQWFSWLEKSMPFQKLLETQMMLFALSSMHPPESVIPEIVKRIQKLHPTFALTSRGTDALSATFRELQKNDYHLEANAPRPAGASAIDIYRFEPVDPILKKTSPVIYQDGVILSSGQNKGGILKAFFKFLGKSPKAVVMIDDQPKHCQRVSDALQPTEISVTCIRYSAEDAKVNAFKAADKTTVTNALDKLTSVLKEIFN